MKTRYIVLIAIVLIFMALGCSGSNNTNTSQPATQVDTPQQTHVKEVPVTIASWEGTSTKNTETFNVPSKEWKISWDTTPGNLGAMNFQIYVYNADGSLKGVAANVVGANQDSSVMRGAGDYYLMVNTGQPYKITVETM